MIDYIEGVIAIKQKVALLEHELLKRNIKNARGLCAEISADARLVSHHLALQFPKETNHEDDV
jgi:hypothetical protein